MVSIYKDKSIFSLVLLIVIAGLLFAPAMIGTTQLLVNSRQGFLYYLLRGLVPLQGGIAVFSFLLLKIITALFINFIANELKLFPKTGFIPALSFLILSAMLPSWMQIMPALIGCMLLAINFYAGVKLYNAVRPQAAIFNLGLITGLNVLLYYAMLPTLLITLYALSVTRPFKLSEWFLLLTGILTPLYFLAGYLFLSGQIELLNEWKSIFTIAPIIDKDIRTTAIALGTAGLFILYGFILAEQSGHQYSIMARKAKAILQVSFVAFIPIVFFIRGSYPDAIVLLAVPGSLLLSYTFLHIKNRYVTAIIFWILTGLTLYMHWGFGK